MLSVGSYGPSKPDALELGSDFRDIHTPAELNGAPKPGYQWYVRMRKLAEKPDPGEIDLEKFIGA